MKKRLFLLLITALLFALAASCAMAESALPQPGDTVEGFTVQSVESFDMFGADVVRFTHDKTGAELIYFANEDTDRAFSLTFRTPTKDDTGLPHVFEHATLDGSEKYPSKTLWFNMLNQSYNTFMNASTMQFLTTYPVASLSEEQLLALADLYTDSCLHPMLMTDESIYREEAWRYNLTNADDALTYEGTVYSEMLGSYTLERAAMRNLQHTLNPDSIFNNEFGGRPDMIPELTWDALKEYHDAYYHPSNSLTVLYGSFDDYAAFLRLLDGYFSVYEAKEFNVLDDPNSTVPAEPVTAVYEYGVDASANTDSEAQIYYSFACGALTEDERNRVDTLTNLLNSDALPMAETMQKQYPAAVFSCSFDGARTEPILSFKLSNANAEDAETFRDTVNEQLALIAENGFDASTLDSIAANIRMSAMLLADNVGMGTNVAQNLSYHWAFSGDAMSYARSMEALNHITEYAENGDYSALITRLCIENPHSALVTTVPVAGLKNEQDAALAEKLAAIKSGMSDEEIEKIVADTAALALPDETDNTEYLNALCVTTVDSLPEEYRVYNLTDKTENGVRYVSAEAGMDGVSTVSVFMDASDLDMDQLMALSLYTDLMFELDTESHSRSEIMSLALRYLYNGDIRVSLPKNETLGVYPRVRATFTTLDEDMAHGYDLLYEVLFETDLSNTDMLKNAITYLRVSMKESIEQQPFQHILLRAAGMSNASIAANSILNGIDFYEYLCGVEARMASDPESVVRELTEVRDAVKNNTNAMVTCAGNATSIELNRAQADAFLARLDSRPIESRKYEPLEAVASESLIVRSNVAYNLLFADYDTLGIERDNGAEAVMTTLVNDAILLPALRDRYGVYSVFHGSIENGIYIITYFDPNIAETFEVFDHLPEFTDGLRGLDQSVLDNYIMNAYSSLAMGDGELSGAQNVILNHITGIEQEETLETMRSMKSLTPEKLDELLNIYMPLSGKGIRSTAAGATAIAESGIAYERTLDPFGSAQESASESMTGEDDGALPNEAEPLTEEDAIALLTGYDLMFSGETDKAVTIGELANLLCKIVGVDYTGEDAISFWRENGYFHGNEDETMSRETLALVIGSLNVAFGGVSDPAEIDESYPDASSIDPEAKDMFSFALANGWILPRENGELAPKADATCGEAALAIAQLLLAER